MLNLSRMQGSPTNFLETIAFTCWRIWKARNDLLFNGRKWTETEIILSSSSQQSEYEACNPLNSITSPTAATPQINHSTTTWTPPPPDHLKINTDGAVNSKDKQGSIGAISRNSDGTIINAIAHKYYGKTSAQEIETLAIREALSWALQQNWSSIIIESDAKAIIDVINHAITIEDSAQNVVMEDILTLQQHFTHCSFSFIHRSCNWVAHDVARKALYDDDLCLSSNLIMDWLQTTSHV